MMDNEFVELEKIGNDAIIDGLDINEEEEEYDHHESFKRGIRRVQR
ncbi:hypothetical protein ACFFK0_17810 [Paenibacillus chartarius]|uniref:Uncharacterized protein n=1 Tax=Paenibacillus chartarius TaxID=747481 RepID=A0ABV6DNR8_9BACL